MRPALRPPESILTSGMGSVMSNYRSQVQLTRVWPGAIPANDAPRGKTSPAGVRPRAGTARDSLIRRVENEQRYCCATGSGFGLSASELR